MWMFTCMNQSMIYGAYRLTVKRATNFGGACFVLHLEQVYCHLDSFYLHLSFQYDSDLHHRLPIINKMAALSLIASSSRSTLPFLPQIQSFLRSSLPQSTILRSTLSTPAWYLSIPGLASLLELLPPIVLAVPKSKISHSRKSMRSANKGLKNKSSMSFLLV